MSRLKREAEEREAIALEAAEVLRRRNMTDEERLDEDRKLGRITGTLVVSIFMHISVFQ